MKILIYSLNYSPELTGIGKYNTEMSEWLSHQGHEVRVVCAPPYYPEWKVGKAYNNWSYKKEKINGIIVYRSPLYIPSKVTFISRIVHLLSFSITSIIPLVRLIGWSPDVIFTTMPSLLSLPNALIFSKFYRSTSWLHIQDLELDALFELSSSVPVAFLKPYLLAIERVILSKFDRVSTISHSIIQALHQKKARHEIYPYFPNWASIAPSTTIIPYDLCAYKELLGVSQDCTIILYSGNIGIKQGLEIVIDAAKALKSDPNVIFLIVGDGAYKRELMQSVQQYGVKNIIFFPLRPANELPFLLSIANIHLIIQKKGVSNIALPSKMTNILAVGGFILLTAEKDTELAKLVSKYPGIAALTDPGDPHKFISSLKILIKNVRMLNDNEINVVAKEYAIKFLSKETVLCNSPLEHFINPRFK
ncbi:MAG: colanic acid biosynthesis glycosyltransferase WcaI [Candidatus Electrothrix sp. AR5]|nr:colanic acid biosynthesis glycosyltransferase WcaI [Candidatus Electrothrix sp. AR5]